LFGQLIYVGLAFPLKIDGLVLFMLNTYQQDERLEGHHIVSWVSILCSGDGKKYCIHNAAG